MIERMSDVPPGVVGVHATGVVTAKDYREVLIPALEEKFKQGDKARLLYVMGPGFERFEAGAMWQDTLFGLRHYFDFRKIAVVTDHSAWARAIRMMAFIIPGAVRVSPIAELEAAKAWAAT